MPGECRPLELDKVQNCLASGTIGARFPVVGSGGGGRGPCKSVA